MSETQQQQINQLPHISLQQQHQPQTTNMYPYSYPSSSYGLNAATYGMNPESSIGVTLQSTTVPSTFIQPPITSNTLYWSQQNSQQQQTLQNQMFPQ